MGSPLVYVIMGLWLVAILPAVAAPLFLDRPKRGAGVTQQPPTIPFRQPAAADSSQKTPVERPAA